MNLLLLMIALLPFFAAWLLMDTLTEDAPKPFTPFDERDDGPTLPYEGQKRP